MKRSLDNNLGTATVDAFVNNPLDQAWNGEIHKDDGRKQNQRHDAFFPIGVNIMFKFENVFHSYNDWSIRDWGIR